jgi:CheY-like chemotaxis protein
MWTLLADDNGEIRNALRLLLEELGVHDIVEARDLAEALQALGHAPPSTEPELGAKAVVLLDWELPAGPYPGGRSGAFVAELKRAAPGCRIIAMSGRPEAREESLRAGCDAFVSRNDPPDRLIALLASPEDQRGC